MSLLATYLPKEFQLMLPPDVPDLQWALAQLLLSGYFPEFAESVFKHAVSGF